MRYCYILFVVLASLATACQQAEQEETTQKKAREQLKVKFSTLIPASEFANSLASVQGKNQAYWLIASEMTGITVYDQGGTRWGNAPGRFEHLSARHIENDIVVATTDAESGDVVLFSFNEQQANLEVQTRLNDVNFQIDAVCLFKDIDNSLFLFLIDGYGGGEQRWIYDGKLAAWIDLHVKGLHLPPEISSCAIDDESQLAFYAEEEIGIWTYSARAESEPKRRLVTAPNTESVKALAATEGLLLAMQPDARIDFYNRRQENWNIEDSIQLESQHIGESIAALKYKETLHIAFIDEESGRVVQAKLPYSDSADSKPKNIYPEVYARAETKAVDRRGDAADDPAIWHNESNVFESRILGTNKKLGLLVYNLQGELLQTLPVGHLNNVDLRTNVITGNNSIDLAVASNRSDNSIDLFIISADGVVSFIEKFATGLREVYGICLYQPQQNQLFVLINDKDGRYQQYELYNDGATFAARLIEEFHLDGQPEACVADDKAGTIYIGEEDKGLWRYDFDPASGKILPDSAQLLAEVGAELQADVEGLALYQTKEVSYLVVSSQGDNSYAVYEPANNFAYVNSFRVNLNSTQRVDGTTETDGLEISSMNFGEVYPSGLVVIQDGYNLMPEEPQNFKYVSWKDLAELIFTD